MFLRIKKIWIFLNNPIAVSTPYQLVKHISLVMAFVENAYHIIYETEGPGQ